MIELTNYFQIKHGLDERTLQSIIPLFQRQTLKRDKFLIRSGQIVKNYYFIENGCFRNYFLHKEKEYTVWIETPGELFTEIKSLRHRQPTEYFIQAIEDTDYYYIDAKVFEDLARSIPGLQSYLVTFWENRFIISLEGFKIFQTMNAQQRYAYIIKHFPRFLDLPLQHLASLVGITQSSLSRIRRIK